MVARLGDGVVCSRMADEPDQSPQQAPQEWIDALAESDADLLAGRTLPWSDARQRLLAAVAAMQAE